MMNTFTLKEGWLLLTGFVVVSLTFAAFVALVSKFGETIALPMLSIAGLVLLLICLSGIAYVFSRMGLQDRTQALGLPAGSIQAVIALSLIVIFAILSVFLFFNVGAVPVHSLKGLTQQESTSQATLLGASFAGYGKETDGTYTIYVRDPGTDARADIGKQLIVLVGTLMTSAVSFYFATRATIAGAVAGASVATDNGDGSGRRPNTASMAEISAIEPAAGFRRGIETPVTITGTGLASATTISFKQGDASLDVRDMRKIATGLSCTVVADPTSPVGPYDLIITSGNTQLATKESAVSVLAST